MLPCSRPGHLYAIDVETVNAGIPYADSFYVMVHYCIERISDVESHFSAYVQIKYRKSVWGLVKGDNYLITNTCFIYTQIHIFVDRTNREK